MDAAVLEELYSTERLPLETGWRRLDDGTLVVSALHRMPGCTWDMLDWWLVRERPFRTDPEMFLRWHPVDHIAIEGDVVRQRIGGVERAGTLSPVDVSRFLDLERLRAAGFGGASAGRSTPAGSDFAISSLIHVGRDTPIGLEVRSRFFLGDTDPPDKFDPETKRKLFTDPGAAALLQHTLEEYAYLASFLPNIVPLGQPDA